MKLRPALAVDAQAMAAAHAQAFDEPWSAHEIATLLAAPGGFAMAVEADVGALAGFILGRAIAGEAEILTLATIPSQRRRGMARALIEAAVVAARAAGSDAMFLEVAANNIAAIRLYEAAGYVRTGLRPGYYAHAAAAPVDALVLRRDLSR